jgi:molecular chaperone GrpE
VTTPERQTEQEVMPPAAAASPPGGADGSSEPETIEVPGADAAAEPGTETAAAGEPEGAADSAAPADSEVPAESADPETELREQAGRYLDLAQRTQADFDNYRKRMAREVRAAEARGIGRLARELLPALDNLDRALQAVESADPTHELTKGVRLVQSELSAALGRGGIQGYDPTGEVFDPNQHEAVAQQPVEGAQSGTIVQVVQSGYRLNDTILRPARVIVAG